MAGEAQLLTQFMVGIGFKIDQGGLRKINEALGASEKNVKRFTEHTQRGTTAWAAFFQQFQKAAGAPAGTN
jgi:hypothetical protein